MNSAAYIVPLIAAKICGIKIVIAHSHNSSNDKGLLKTIAHNINKLFIPLFANKFFACSEDAGKWFFSKKILNGPDFYIIKNAIDTKIDGKTIKKSKKKNTQNIKDLMTALELSLKNV